MVCSSCNKQKNTLTPKKSSIVHGVTLLMCQSCLENSYEPRWAIILGGRQKGPESVRDYVLKRRYLGDTISAEELIV